MKTLTIKDLSTSKELDGKAMSAVRGGAQANGLTQFNAQGMVAGNSVGNFIGAGGPVTVQSHIDNTQDAHNDAYQYNFKGVEIFAVPVPFLP